MAEWITSKANATLQHVRKLLSNRKYRYQCRAFVADGTKLVEEALRWGAEVQCLIVQEGVELSVPAPVREPEGGRGEDGADRGALSAPAPVRELRVPAGLMKELSRMESPQGVLAVCRMPEPRPLVLRPGMLILDGIQDPGNLGTILRTADAFDVPVVLADGCADPYGEKTVRATMGAVFRVPPQQARSEEILSQCRRQALPVCVTALSSRAEDLRRIGLGACLPVIGSEGGGVSEAFLAAADREAIIPMNAHCESLNAAVAATVVLWELRRKGE